MNTTTTPTPTTPPSSLEKEKEKVPYLSSAIIPSIAFDDTHHPPSPSDALPNDNVDPNWDAAMEKAVMRKLDLRISPIAGFAYFLLFLDRSNIGGSPSRGVCERGEELIPPLFYLFSPFYLS
jgi:hypothetical protein